MLKRICFRVVKCLARIIAVCGWWVTSWRGEVAALSLHLSGTSTVDFCRSERSGTTTRLSLALCLVLELYAIQLWLYQLHFSLLCLICPLRTFAFGICNLFGLWWWLRRFGSLLRGRTRAGLLALLALEVATTVHSGTYESLDRRLLAPLSTRAIRFGG